MEEEDVRGTRRPGFIWKNDY